MEIISHPLYFAPIPLYTRLYSGTGLIIDGDTPFVKQTFRSRAIIASENGPLSLNIPVAHDSGRTAMRNVRISEHGNWRRQHWNALISAYRNSPFFDYYADDFAHFYEERDNFLIDFNLRLHNTVCELLGLNRELTIATTEEITTHTATHSVCDLRHWAEPQAIQSLTEQPQPYYQVFASRHKFQPNLSIADLLFNMGPEGLITLKEGSK